MSMSFELSASARKDVGKGASRRLRHANKVPAVIYGANKAAESLVFEQNEIIHALENEAFYSHVLTINVDGKKQKAILKDVQRHPFRLQILHLDLLRVVADQAIRVHVPLHFIGEEGSPGVKGGGMVSHNQAEVEVECLPKNLPEFIEVDVSALDVGALLHISDLVLPKGVTAPQLAQGEEQDAVVYSIHHARGGSSEDEEEGEEGEAED